MPPPQTVAVRARQRADWDDSFSQRHSSRLQSVLSEGFCCSGVLFPGGYVLAPAFIVAPLHSVDDLNRGVEVSALIVGSQQKRNEKTVVVEGKVFQWATCTVIRLFRNEDFYRLMQQYFPETRCNKLLYESGADKELRDLQLGSKISLSDFLVLRIEECYLSMSFDALILAGSVCKGDRVYVYGCPFGWTLPEVFHNSVSSGVVSNMLGLRNEMLITDARCVDGMEGGVMTVVVNNEEYLVGVVVTRIMGKSDGCTSSLAVVASIESIRRSLDVSEPQLALLLFGSLRACVVGLRASRAADSVVHIIAGRNAGSGVVIDSDLNLVLTCGHVVQRPNTRVHVKLPCGEIGATCSANIVWISDVPDVAILRVNTSTRLQSLTLYDGRSSDLTRSSIRLIGHMKLSHHETGPTVTHGIVSNVVCDDDQPVMLQMSAIIDEGASGGAIILDNTNELVGIAACNVSNKTGHTRYCDISLAIPVTWIQSLIQIVKRQGQLSDVQQQLLSSEAARRLWQLQSSVDHQSLKSKL